MATSSERSPPPFPDSEDQELEAEEEVGDDNSDEGEDIFLGADDPLETKMDPPLPANDITTKSQRDIFSEPPPDIFSDPLSDPVGQTKSDVINNPAKEIVSEPTNVIEVASDDMEEATDIAEALVDITETPTDIAEALIDITETPTDIAEALIDITETPTNITEAVSGNAEAPKDIFEDSTDIMEATSYIPEVPKDVIKEPCDVMEAANDIVEAASNIAEAPKDIIKEPCDVMEAESDTDEEPEDTIEEPRDVMEAANDIVEAASDTSEEPEDIIEEPRDVMEAANDTVEGASDTAEEPEDIIEEPRDVMEAASDTAEEPEDIIEEPRDVMEAANDTVEAASNTVEAPKDAIKELSDITEPPSDIFSEPLNANNEPENDIESHTEASSAPMIDILSEPLRNDIKEPTKTDIIDPLADILNDTPLSDVKAPVADITNKPPRDLFEDEPSDLFRELPQSSTAKQQQTNLFNEPDDEDLFSESLASASSKSHNVLFDEVVGAAKGDSVCGPLSDNYTEDPTDIFTEEALTSVPSAVNTSSVNPKTNGVHSDEEPDIFAEATVELSLDSPRNDRKKKEAAKPSASAPSLSVAPSVSKPQPKTLEELEEEESEDKFELNISITNPEKVGDGMNAYMAYKVSTQTTLAMFRNKTFTVRRRFSDFLGLYEKLSEKHAQNGYIVPPPPEKSILGMTKVKVGKEDPSSAEFVERRRAALERYLQRVVCHPSLLQDPDVREFLEREELPRAVSTQALSGAGFLKMINKATDSLSKMTIKMNESDVWFEEKLQEVESEDQQLRKLHVMVESLVNHRKELSVNTAGFAKSVAMLGSSEDNTALSRALSQLAEVEDKMEQLHQDQAANDSYNFAELLADYVRLLGSVRASFDQRMKSWQRWQDAQNMLQKKRETEAKLLWANKPEKLQQAKDDIAEWEAKVTQYERDFDKVSATVRKEVLRFEKEKARDFKKQIIKYLESLLQSQQQLIKYWEAFLPEAKAIA